MSTGKTTIIHNTVTHVKLRDLYIFCLPSVQLTYEWKMYEYSEEGLIRMLQLASKVHPNIQPRLVPSA